MILLGKALKYSEKPCHGTILCSIPDRLARDKTQVFVVTGLKLVFSVNSIANSKFSSYRICSCNTDDIRPGIVKCLV